MMEAFSKAREYCEVGLWVKASNLEGYQQLEDGNKGVQQDTRTM